MANPTDEIDRATMRAALRRLPMFPLPEVLFPHALLPLHIFEDRYRALARDVVGSHRMMAIGHLISDDGEEGKRGVPAVHAVAGAGEVVMIHELPDGRFNLILRGRLRIRIVEELPSPEPYRLVHAVEMPDVHAAAPAELADADASLRALVGSLADAIPEGGEILRQVVAAQEGPAELVNVLAASLVADTTLRQRLLETTDVQSRIERVAAEVVAMTARISQPDRFN